MRLGDRRARPAYVNLLLVSIDSLRGDHLSRTHPAVATPRFDRLTSAFGLAPNCFSVSSATRPVHLSLVTGLYPFEHGILSQRQSSQRRGVPMLFDVCRGAGISCAALSEAGEIFEGLDLGVPVVRRPPRAEEGVRKVLARLGSTPGSQCVLLHYWSTHTPYGADDGRALGETADLLASGRRDLVTTRYHRAVEKVFERKLAPLIEAIDLAKWAVLVFGDHGESWTDGEPYHGLTLDNSVLRVPLLLHVPFRDNSRLVNRRLVSLIDLFPTVLSLLRAPCDYRGFGRPLWEAAGYGERYLAQIVPLKGRGRLIEKPGEDSGKKPEGGLLWALFDDREKFTWDEGTGSGVLAETLTDRVLEPLARQQTVAAYTDRYRRLVERSEYAGRPLPNAPDPGQDLLVERRLRDLGYLE